MAESKQNGGLEVNFTFTTSVHTYIVKNLFCKSGNFHWLKKKGDLVWR